MKPREHKHMTFSTGAQRSDRSGKGRYDLVSPYGLKRLAIQYEEGAAHHKDARNWILGFPISRAVCSAIGHLMDHLAGDRSEDHLAAAAWQEFAAMHFEELIEQGKLPVALNDVPFDATTLPADTGTERTKFYITRETVTHVTFHVTVSDGAAGELTMLKGEFQELVKRLSGLVDVIEPKTEAEVEAVEVVIPAGKDLPDGMSWTDWFSQEHDLLMIQNITGFWAETKFPEMTNGAILEHLRRELVELRDSNYSPEEAADCFLILLHLAYKNNFNLLGEILKKHKINTERTWATEPDAGGVYLHLKEKANEQV